MSEKIYITCVAEKGANEQLVAMEGELVELGFLTTVIVNAVRKEFIKAGHSDFESKLLILGGIEAFWGKNSQLEVKEDESISK